MKLAATLMLALVLPSTALAAPKLKPRPQSPAASAATARIAEQNIPKVVKYAKPKPADLASILPGAAAAANPEVPKAGTPPAATEPLLTADELAVDIVELTPQSLHSPQIATTLVGLVSTFGRELGLRFSPPRTEQITFGASVQWINGHSLLVECTGKFPEPHWIRIWRMSMLEVKAELIGSLNVDLGGDTLAFVVPSSPLAGWERLGMTISDANGDGSSWRIDKCTFTRL